MNKKISKPATYAEIDRWCYDYGLLDAPEGYSHRGPVAADAGAPVIVLGAASTFGRLVERPFAQQVTEQYGIPTVNFGFAGPGPKVFEQFEEIINRHPCVVVTFFSGRSVSTPFLQSDNQRKRIAIEGLTVSSPELQRAFARVNGTGIEIGDPIPVGAYLPARAAWSAILHDFDQAHIKEMVQETRQAYLQSMRRLLGMIRGKKVLMWFSERQPAYTLSFDSVPGLFGKFPQLVDQALVETLALDADGYVECVTDRGMPFKIRTPRDGKPYPRNIPSGINRNYPSQEMHDDAARALGDFLSDFLPAQGIAY